MALNLSGPASELIIKLRLDATGVGVTYKELEEAVKSYRNTTLSTQNVLDGSLDRQFADLQEIEQLWKQISNTIKGASEANINALTGVNTRVQFATATFGELLQTVRTLENERADIQIGTEAFDDVQSKLQAVNTQIKTLETDAKAAGKTIGGAFIANTPTAEELAAALKSASDALVPGEASIRGINDELKKLKALQSTVAVGSAEFDEVTKSIVDLEQGLRGVKAAQKQLETSELIDVLISTKDASQLTANELKEVQKALQQQIQNTQVGTAEFDQYALQLRQVNEGIESYKANLKAATTEQLSFEDAIKQSEDALASEETSINDLNAQLKQLKAAQNAVAVGSEDFKRIAKAVQDVEDKLKDAKEATQEFKKETKDTGGIFGAIFDKVEDGLGDFKGVFEQMGVNFDGLREKFAGGGGKGGAFGPLLIGGTLAVAAISAVISKLVELGAEVIEASAEFTEFRKSVASFTGATGSELDALTAKTKTIADAFGADVGETISAASNLANQFGISADEALTLLNDGLANAGPKADEVLGSLEEFSGTFKQAGLSAQQATQVIATALDSGIKPDKFVDAINEANIKLLDESEDTAKAINAAFGNTFGDELITKVKEGQLTTVQALESVTNEAVKTGLGASDARAALIAVTGSMGEEAGTVESFAKAFGNLASGTLELSQEQKKAKQALLDNQEVSLAYNDSLNELNRSLGPLTQAADNFFIQIKTGVATAITFAIETFDRWGSGIKLVWELLKGIYIAFGRMVDAVTEATSVTDAFRRIVIALWQNLQDLIAIFTEYITTAIKLTSQTWLAEAAVSAFDAVVKFFTDSIDSLLNGLNSVVDTLGEWINSNETISAGLSSIRSTASEMLDYVTGLINDLVDGVREWIAQNEFLQATFDGIAAAAQAVAGFLTDLYASVTGFFTLTEAETAKAVSNSLKKTEDTRKKQIGKTNQEKAKEAEEAAKAAAKAAEEAGKAANEALKKALESASELRKQAYLAEAENQQQRFELLKRTQEQEVAALKAQAGFVLLTAREQGILLKQIDRKFGEERIAILEEQLENSNELQLLNLDRQTESLKTAFGKTESQIQKIEIEAGEARNQIERNATFEAQKILDQRVANQLVSEEERVKNQNNITKRLQELSKSDAALRKQLQKILYDDLITTTNRAAERQERIANTQFETLIKNTRLTEQERFQIEFSFKEDALKRDIGFIDRKLDEQKKAVRDGLISEEESAEVVSDLILQRAQKERNLYESIAEYSQRMRDFRKQELQLLIETGGFKQRIDAIKNLYDEEIEAAEGNLLQIKKLEAQKTAAVVSETTKQAEIYAGMYSGISQAAAALVDQLDEARKGEIEKETESSQERQQIAEDNVSELEAKAEKLTGRKRRLALQEVATAKQAANAEVATQKKLETELAEIERQAQIRKQILALADVAINTARGIAGVLASTAADPTGILRAIQIAAIVATGALQAATIASQVFEFGGQLPEGELKGPSHREGGIKIRTRGGGLYEAEGGELVMTRGVAANPGLRSMASAINAAAGGVRFERGGYIPMDYLAAGGILANPSAAIASADSQTAALAAAIGAEFGKLPPSEVAVTEIDRVQKRVVRLREQANI